MSTPLAVLRLGHRTGRDPRITTHLGLTARALGADVFLLAGDHDPGLLSGLRAVRQRFGGAFEAMQVRASGLGWLRNFVKGSNGAPAGQAVHLTMYGMPWREAVPRIRRDLPTVVVAGGPKVPGEVYQLCQHNVAVGNQPHSEVAALALFLDAWSGQSDHARPFTNPDVEVVPSPRIKRMERRDKAPQPPAAFVPAPSLLQTFNLEQWLHQPPEADPEPPSAGPGRQELGWQLGDEEE